MHICEENEYICTKHIFVELFLHFKCGNLMFQVIIWTIEDISGCTDLDNKEILATILTMQKDVTASYFMSHAYIDSLST